MGAFVFERAEREQAEYEELPREAKINAEHPEERMYGNSDFSAFGLHSFQLRQFSASTE